MEMNERTLREFRQDFQQAVKSLEEKYGVVITAKGITYSDNEFHFKTEVVNGSSKDDVRKTQFEQSCKKYFLEKEDFMREFEVRGVTYQIVGIQPSKRKHPIMIKDVRSGKEYCCGTDFIPFAKERESEWYRNTMSEIETHTTGEVQHICPYCHKLTNGMDTDLLCPECQERFGHTFYSEL